MTKAQRSTIESARTELENVAAQLRKIPKPLAGELIDLGALYAAIAALETVG